MEVLHYVLEDMIGIKIICIQKTDNFALGQSETLIQRVIHALIWFTYHIDMRITGEDIECSISGSAIYDDMFHGGVILTQNTLNSSFNIFSAVKAGCDNGYTRRHAFRINPIGGCNINRIVRLMK